MTAVFRLPMAYKINIPQNFSPPNHAAPVKIVDREGKKHVFITKFIHSPADTGKLGAVVVVNQQDAAGGKP
jgi:hypothetical protein